MSHQLRCRSAACRAAFANDVLLSHMITFLNDKNDKQLRMAFFKCIVGVAIYIGVHCSPILSPLLQQNPRRTARAINICDLVSSRPEEGTFQRNNNRGSATRFPLSKA
ncbi:phosphoinositide-3-kinase, regulatory subunit 4 [Homalodisca vitripennis]|nr:phosphoinositide-3-kinase, regulatory subunit 4 [Homalodisca vitripennis]